jgi:transcription initiation factor TFIIIB Brf1 subunit/transcription initiation factor TFIIB
MILSFFLSLRFAKVTILKFRILYSISKQVIPMTNSKSSTKNPRESVVEEAIRILRELNCTDIVQEETMSIIDRADTQNLLSQGSSKALAGGIIYIASILCDDRMTLAAIGCAAKVSGGTVGKTYLLIARGLGYSERNPDRD